jgi:hypothetical protein
MECWLNGGGTNWEGQADIDDLRKSFSASLRRAKVPSMHGVDTRMVLAASARITPVSPKCPQVVRDILWGTQTNHPVTERNPNLLQLNDRLGASRLKCQKKTHDFAEDPGVGMIQR